MRERTHTQLIEVLKLRLAKIPGKQAEINAETNAEVEKIDAQIETMLRGAGLWEGMMHLQAARSGVFEYAQQRMEALNRQGSELSGALDVMVQLKNGTQAHVPPVIHLKTG